MSTYKDMYAIEPKPLGSGGWARVLAGVHRVSSERHAIKTLINVAEEEPKGRLRREIFVQRDLQERTEHVMPVVLADADNGWYSMPVASMRFADLPRPVPDEVLLPIVTGVCGALVVAHDRAWVHRDLSPGNVLRMEVGGRQRWVVSDWGMVTKPIPGMTFQIRTTIVGTPGFAAPEAFDDEQVSDIRADFYGLGRLIAWARKPKGKLEQNVPWLPDDPWRDVVEHTTRHNREERPSSMVEVGQLLAPIVRAIAAVTPRRLATAAMEVGRVEDLRGVGGALWVHVPFEVNLRPWGWAGHHGMCGRAGYFTKAKGEATDLVEGLIAELGKHRNAYVKELDAAMKP